MVVLQHWVVAHTQTLNINLSHGGLRLRGPSDPPPIPHPLVITHSLRLTAFPSHHPANLDETASTPLASAGFKLRARGAPSGRLSRYEAALYQRAKDGNPNQSWRSDTSSESWRSRL